MRSAIRATVDEEIRATRALASVPVPPGGWLRTIQYALGLSLADVARRLGVTAPAVSQAQRSEAEGSIQLSTLRRMAEAMDCTLVYALIPRVPLEEAVWERARERAREELGRVSRTMALEAQDVRFSDDRVDELARRLIDRSGLWREEPQPR